MGCISHFIWFFIIFSRKHQSCERAKHLTQFNQFIVLPWISGNKYLSEFYTTWLLYHFTHFSFVVNRLSRKIVIDLCCNENVMKSQWWEWTLFNKSYIFMTISFELTEIRWNLFQIIVIIYSSTQNRNHSFCLHKKMNIL